MPKIIFPVAPSNPVPTIVAETSPKIAPHAYNTRQRFLAHVPADPWAPKPPGAQPSINVQVPAMAVSRQEHQRTRIVFDWDDTCLASSQIRYRFGANSFRRSAVNAATHEKFRPLDEETSATLLRASELGQLAIITNASRGWFEESAKALMPKTWNAIVALAAANRLSFVSARDVFHPVSSNSHYWKRAAFDEVLTFAMTQNPGEILNVISLGDGLAEMKATEAFAQRKLPGSVYAKRIQFVRDPSVDTLCSELRTVREQLPAWSKMRDGFKIPLATILPKAGTHA